MKVLITVPWGARLGGAENVLWSFLRHVDRERITPIVVFLAAGPFEQEVADLGFQTYVVPAGRLRHIPTFARSVHEIATLLKLTRPDLLINWSAKTQLYGALAALVSGMAGDVIWWQHGIPNGHWLDRLATLLPARAIACCSASAKSMQDSQWPRRPTVVLYPGIDKPLEQSRQERNALRERLSIKAGDLVIGIVGRLQPWKGQHRFLRALATLIERGHRVRGLVVGGDSHALSPDYDGYLRNLVYKLGIEGHVVFTGHVPDPARYFELMDISVNASIGEPFGLTILESMALSVPVLAFGIGGPTEILDSGRAGVIVPPGDELGLANALETLVCDPELRLRIGRSGYERFAARFSSDRTTRQMERWLMEICPN